jgi:hypothetical protein
MATASQVVEQKVLENDIKDVKQKIHVLEDNSSRSWSTRHLPQRRCSCWRSD